VEDIRGGVPGAAAMADGSISEGTFMERERGGDLDGSRGATDVLIEGYVRSFIPVSDIIMRS
jgi:hypothetical protein